MPIGKEETPWECLSEETLLSEFVAPVAAKQLIAEYASIYNILQHTSEQQLAGITGIGKAKLRKLACIKSVIQRMEQERKKQIQRITHKLNIKHVSICIQFAKISHLAKR